MEKIEAYKGKYPHIFWLNLNNNCVTECFVLNFQGEIHYVQIGPLDRDIKNAILILVNNPVASLDELMKLMLSFPERKTIAGTLDFKDE